MTIVIFRYNILELTSLLHISLTTATTNADKYQYSKYALAITLSHYLAFIFKATRIFKSPMKFYLSKHICENLEAV